LHDVLLKDLESFTSLTKEFRAYICTTENILSVIYEQEKIGEGQNNGTPLII